MNISYIINKINHIHFICICYCDSFPFFVSEYFQFLEAWAVHPVNGLLAEPLCTFFSFFGNIIILFFIITHYQNFNVKIIKMTKSIHLVKG